MKRIVRIVNGDEVYYEVEHKVLFWWETCKYDCSFGSSPRRFKTMEEVELFIKGRSENIIKYIK